MKHMFLVVNMLLSVFPGPATEVPAGSRGGNRAGCFGFAQHDYSWVLFWFYRGGEDVVVLFSVDETGDVVLACEG